MFEGDAVFGNYDYDNYMRNPYRPQQPNNYGFPNQNGNFFNGMNGQQVQQPQPQPQQVQQSFEFPRVSGFEDVKNIHLEPGQRQWFMFEDDPIMGVKMLDNMGVKTYTRFFLMKEISPEEYLNKGKVQNQEFVPVKEFNEAFSNLQHGFELKIKEMEQKIMKLQKGMKNNAEPFKQYVETTATEPTEYADDE